MRITVAYEILRPRHAGYATTGLLVSESPMLGDTFMVDVHTPKVIQEAEDSNDIVKALMAELQDARASRLYPGCDLITIRGSKIDRMIELNSSTVDARSRT